MLVTPYLLENRLQLQDDEERAEIRRQRRHTLPAGTSRGIHNRFPSGGVPPSTKSTRSMLPFSGSSESETDGTSNDLPFIDIDGLLGDPATHPNLLARPIVRACMNGFASEQRAEIWRRLLHYPDPPTASSSTTRRYLNAVESAFRLPSASLTNLLTAESQSNRWEKVRPNLPRSFPDPPLLGRVRPFNWKGGRTLVTTQATNVSSGGNEIDEAAHAQRRIMCTLSASYPEMIFAPQLAPFILLAFQVFGGDEVTTYAFVEESLRRSMEDERLLLLSPVSMQLLVLVIDRMAEKELPDLWKHLTTLATAETITESKTHADQPTVTQKKHRDWVIDLIASWVSDLFLSHGAPRELSLRLMDLALCVGMIPACCRISMAIFRALEPHLLSTRTWHEAKEKTYRMITRINTDALLQHQVVEKKSVTEAAMAVAIALFHGDVEPGLPSKHEISRMAQTICKGTAISLDAVLRWPIRSSRLAVMDANRLAAPRNIADLLEPRSFHFPVLPNKQDVDKQRCIMDEELCHRLYALLPYPAYARDPTLLYSSAEDDNQTGTDSKHVDPDGRLTHLIRSLEHHAHETREGLDGGVLLLIQDSNGHRIGLYLQHVPPLTASTLTVDTETSATAVESTSTSRGDDEASRSSAESTYSNDSMSCHLLQGKAYIFRCDENKEIVGRRLQTRTKSTPPMEHDLHAHASRRGSAASDRSRRVSLLDVSSTARFQSSADDRETTASPSPPAPNPPPQQSTDEPESRPLLPSAPTSSSASAASSAPGSSATKPSSSQDQDVAQPPALPRRRSSLAALLDAFHLGSFIGGDKERTRRNKENGPHTEDDFEAQPAAAVTNEEQRMVKRLVELTPPASMLRQTQVRIMIPTADERTFTSTVNISPPMSQASSTRVSPRSSIVSTSQPSSPRFRASTSGFSGSQPSISRRASLSERVWSVIDSAPIRLPHAQSGLQLTPQAPLSGTSDGSQLRSRRASDGSMPLPVTTMRRDTMPPLHSSSTPNKLKVVNDSGKNVTNQSGSTRSRGSDKLVDRAQNLPASPTGSSRAPSITCSAAGPSISAAGSASDQYRRSLSSSSHSSALDAAIDHERQEQEQASSTLAVPSNSSSNRMMDVTTPASSCSPPLPSFEETAAAFRALDSTRARQRQENDDHERDDTKSNADAPMESKTAKPNPHARHVRHALRQSDADLSASLEQDAAETQNVLECARFILTYDALIIAEPSREMLLSIDKRLNGGLFACRGLSLDPQRLTADDNLGVNVSERLLPVVEESLSIDLVEAWTFH